MQGSWDGFSLKYRPGWLNVREREDRREAGSESQGRRAVKKITFVQIEIVVTKGGTEDGTGIWPFRCMVLILGAAARIG